MSLFEERIEAAAVELAGGRKHFYEYPNNEDDRDTYRADARAALLAADAVVTEEAHDEGMDAVDWDMVRDGVGDPQEAASIAVRAALEAAGLFRGGAK